MNHFRRVRLRVLLIAATTASLVSAAVAADWPQWGGSDLGRNMVSPERNLADGFKPRAPMENVRWTATLGNAIEGNPTVAGGRVFIGTDDANLINDSRFSRQRGGMVQCLDEATGVVLWRLPVPPRGRDRLPQGAHYGQQNLGVCSSPAVSGKRAYVVTNSCEVLCLDVNGMADGNDGTYQDEGKYMAGAGNPPAKVGKQDGDILWSFDLIDQLGICPHDVAACSVLLDGRFLYVVSCNGVDAPHAKCLRPDAPSFIVLDTETGKLLATDTEGLGKRMWHCLWSPPSIGVVNGKKLVFFGGADGICYAFEALTSLPETPIHLTKVWQCDCVPPNYRMPDGKAINYYVGDKRKKYTTNKNDGTFVGPSEIISTPVFHEGRVYCTIGQDPTHGRGRGMLTCIDASKTGDVTGTGIVWTYPALERTIASVAISDGLLYAVDLPGRIHCLDVVTGKPYWVFDTNAEAWGTPLVADGKVYVTNKKGLVVMAAGREAHQLSLSPLGSASYATPIAANGTLFIASDRILWAVQKPAGVH
ncbi:outer membrane protein assembly factor BamB family protein [Humisphaera borealis]|uniref:PQQ-binding-like beta-propeller repeat protein n=1 Tax=Humisphaera borealis TaxID=2807512 RepID=A0A7M2X449_9BACT|nr:PQQ-binding-like beta-propeller repeat protein [Humisphaera borealis]QOV91540.1 PQQ-binding-like beta-propeller repeat protein [Humisphaera borealis]